MQDAKPEYSRYLDPQVLARISGLELRARLIVEGFFSGMHRSPHRGLSIEYADHRAYTQGDDIRHIDWKVFGRTDKHYIKEYEQETNLDLMLAVDGSESMNYRSSPKYMTKRDYATTLAASMAYLALRQQDSVGLALFDDRVRHFLRPSNNAQQWKTIVRELSGPSGPAKTALGRVFAELAERLSHRTLIIIISDLFDDLDGIFRGMRLLRYRRHEVIVFNLWDPAELTFPFRGPTMFDGLESSGTLLTEPGSLRTRYLEEVERFQDRLRAGCGRLQIDVTLFDTASPLGSGLTKYLAARSARLRHRSSRVLGRI